MCGTSRGGGYPLHAPWAEPDPTGPQICGYSLSQKRQILHETLPAQRIIDVSARLPRDPLQHVVCLMIPVQEKKQEILLPSTEPDGIDSTSTQLYTSLRWEGGGWYNICFASPLAFEHFEWLDIGREHLLQCRQARQPCRWLQTRPGPGIPPGTFPPLTAANPSGSRPPPGEPLWAMLCVARCDCLSAPYLP